MSTRRSKVVSFAAGRIERRESSAQPAARDGSAGPGDFRRGAIVARPRGGRRIRFRRRAWCARSPFSNLRHSAANELRASVAFCLWLASNCSSAAGPACASPNRQCARVLLEPCGRGAGVLVLAQQVLQRLGCLRELVERRIDGREELELVAQPLGTDPQLVQLFRLGVAAELAAELPDAFGALAQILLEAVADAERPPASQSGRARGALEERGEGLEQLAIAFAFEQGAEAMRAPPRENAADAARSRRAPEAARAASTCRYARKLSA